MTDELAPRRDAGVRRVGEDVDGRAVRGVEAGQARGHRGRSELGDPDGGPGERVAQGERVAEQGRLERGVERREGLGGEGASGGDVDDLCGCAATHQLRDQQVVEVDGPAEQHAQLLLPYRPRVVVVGQGDPALDPGVVHHDVEVGQDVEHVVDETLAVRRPARVADDGLEPGELTGRDGEPRGRAPGHQHARAVAQVPPRQLEPDALAAAGDEDVLGEQ